VYILSHTYEDNLPGATFPQLRQGFSVRVILHGDSVERPADIVFVSPNSLDVALLKLSGYNGMMNVSLCAT
jgi:hypothetical protein